MLKNSEIYLKNLAERLRRKIFKVGLTIFQHYA